MLMVIPDQGKTLWLDWMLRPGDAPGDDFTLHLYKNDYTPDDDSALGDFVEADFTGYESYPIERANFANAVINTHVAYSTHTPAPSFTCTASPPQTVYGWYLTWDFDDTVVAAQRFDTPREMGGGSVENIDPFKLGLKTFT